MGKKVTADRQENPGAWKPWSRRRYYVTETFLVVYTLFWLWAWYGIVYKADLPLAVRIMIGIVLAFARVEGPFFEPYEKAMKRMAKLRGHEGDARGGEGAGGTMGDGAMDDTD